jgi:thiosulfate dehydrogenase
MHKLRSIFFPVGLAMVFFILMIKSFQPTSVSSKPYIKAVYNEYEEWQPPDESLIPFTEEGELIRYGKALIANTSEFLGPKGIVAQISNGMNCQNCHLKAGTQNFSNPFSAVASTYPRYRERNNRMESIAFRVNECMKRSLNGKALDSTGTEMKAMIAYLKWLGKDVPTGVKPVGSGTEELPFLNRAADTIAGKNIFVNKCQRCHQANGQGELARDGSSYVYPPLWGPNSFNVSAGLYRLSRLAGFIRNSMPFGISYKNPELTAEQSWDVAAFIASQPRPVRFFSDDWPDSSKKPVDYPFGPWADQFTALQHKYGPFEPIKNRKSSSDELLKRRK